MTPCARRGVRGAALVALATGALARPAAAQTPAPRDTLAPAPAGPVPSLVLRADSLAADSLRRLARLDAARAALSARAPDPLVAFDAPARRPARDLADAVLLGVRRADDARGTFALRTDAPGFPTGLVRWGLDPGAVTLESGDAASLPGAQSLATGAARFDVVPLSTAADVRWDGARLVVPQRVFDAPRPLTELRYVAAGPEQRVEATHAQARRRRLLGADGIARVALTYAGRGGDGPFANQRLTRGRTLDARIAFDARGAAGQERVEGTSTTGPAAPGTLPSGPVTSGTRTELRVTHHRGTFGASGGVLPPDAADPYSLFDRIRAVPRDDASSRGSLGTSATLALARGRSSLALGADTETLRFRATAATAGADTTEGRVRRLRAAARVPVGRRFSLSADGAFDAGSGAFDTAVLSGSARLATAASAGGLRLRLGAGADVQGGTLVPAGQVVVEAGAGRLGITAEASQALAPVSAVRVGGFGRFLPAAASDAALRVRLARAGVALGPATGLRLTLDAFASETRGWMWRADPGEGVAVSGGAVAVRATGAAAGVGVREAARSGLYGGAWAQATVGADAPGVPPVAGNARAGVRARLFRGDLDADAFVRLRAWSAFVSRVLHEPTGLLLLPADPDAARVRAGTQLDFIATAHVRTATLHIALDNALAGTILTRGSLTVPGYPMAGRRLRVGVFWPIFD